MKGWQVSVMQFPEQPKGASGRVFCRELRRAIAGMLRPALVLGVPPTLNLNSDALDSLIRCARDAVNHDAELALAVPNPCHRVVLNLTRLSSVLPTFPSVKEAIAHLNSSAKRATGVSVPGVPSISTGDRIYSQKEDSQP